MDVRALFFTFIAFILSIFYLDVAVAQPPTTATKSAAPSFSSASNSESNNESIGVFEVIESGAGAISEWASQWSSDNTGINKQSWNSTRSPRHTVMTFVNAMHTTQRSDVSAWQTALKTLPSQYASESDAKTLFEIFVRLGEIDPILLPSEATINKSGIQTFEVFPYALDHKYVWKKINDAPNGSIVVEINDQGQWLFSTDTMRGASDLLSSIKSIPPQYITETKGKLFFDVFGPTFEQTPWWGWVALLAIFILGCFAGHYCKRFLNKAAVKLSNHGWMITAALTKGIGNPLGLVIATLSLIIGLAFINFSTTLSTLRWELIQILLLIALAWLTFSLVDLVTAALRKSVSNKNNEFTEMAIELVKRSIRVFITVIIIVFILENLLGVNIGALITGIGVIGLALSLAGKESAQNLFGAFYIFFNRPFIVGDWVEYKDRIGEVEDVGIQATSIRVLSGEVLVVPNKQFIDNEVENLSLRKYLRREMDISLTYHTPHEKIGEAIDLVKSVLSSDDIVNEGKFDMKKRPPFVSFSEYGDYSLNLKVYYWYFIGDNRSEVQRRDSRGWYSYLSHASMVNRALLEAFNKKGIEFAFPTQTLHLQNERDTPTLSNENTLNTKQAE